MKYAATDNRTRPLPRHWSRHAALAFALFLACDESPTGPDARAGVGTLRVVVTTTGGDVDEDGYIVAFKDRRLPVTMIGSVNFVGVPAVTDAVELQNVAANCTVLDGGPSRTVTVIANVTTQVEFQVACDPTGVRIITVTSGPELPPSYRVYVGGGSARIVVPNGSLEITRLTPGDHLVAIDDVVDGCELDGDRQRTISVEFRTVTAVTFTVTCGALTAAVRVSVATTGVDLDPDGYRVAAGERSAAVPANGVAMLDQMPAGMHEIRLEGIASNCELSGADHVTVTLTVGGTVRDTAHVRFDLSCARTDKIAYTSFAWYDYTGQIIIAYADGSHPVFVATGNSPSWFPDGRRLAFSDGGCSYYGNYCGGGLKVLDTETGAAIAVPTGGIAIHPAVSPNADRIAYVDMAGGSALMVARLDGAAPVRVREGPAEVPDWSPDGARLIYGCRASTGSNDLCVIDADGTGFARLTSLGGFSSHPRWSPDGTRIVFASTAFTASAEIVTMAPDGSGFQRLTTGWSPSWAPDGSRILFARNDGIYAINSDGTGLTRITTGSHVSPAWRP